MKGLTMRPRLLLAASLLLALPGLLLAQGSPVDTWRRGAGLGDEYSEFNTHLIQVQTIKAIPFFQLTPAQRYDRLKGYYQTARQGGVKQAGGSARQDFSSGTLVKDVAIAFLTTVLTQMSQGRTADESITRTMKYLSSAEYVVGNLVGGTLGAALGAMVPVPLFGGFAGNLMLGVPMMAGAMLGSNVGSKLVSQIRHGDVDLAGIFASIDWLDFTMQAVGATAGMLLGDGLGVPFFGQVVGGVLGGTIGLKISGWLKEHLLHRAPGTFTAPALAAMPSIAAHSAAGGLAAPVASASSTLASRGAVSRAYLGAERDGRRDEAAALYHRYVELGR
jgi:hypothetical protein